MRTIVNIAAILLLAVTMCRAEDKPQFKTEKTAIESYRVRLKESKGESLKKILSVFPFPDEKSIRTILSQNDAQEKKFFARAGKLVCVDVCLAPKLGKSLQRAGYIFTYDHGLGFIDVWFIRCEKGWSISNVKFDFNTKPIKTIEDIPSMFFQK